MGEHTTTFVCRAVPIFSEDGTVAGVLSTHFVDVHYALMDTELVPEQHLDTIRHALEDHALQQLH